MIQQRYGRDWRASCDLACGWTALFESHLAAWEGEMAHYAIEHDPARDPWWNDDERDSERFRFEHQAERD